MALFGNFVVFLIVLMSATWSVKCSALKNVFQFEQSSDPGSELARCDPKICKLPNCFCSGAAIPGNLKLKDTPQLVVLTFQNAVTDDNFKLYQELFHGPRKNPNGCPATGTFFVSHEYTNYFQVQTLLSQRHEIGDNTVTWGKNQSSWKRADYKTWLAEVQSQRQILSKWANASLDNIRGFRAPYLQLGGDNEYSALQASKLTYDASRTSIAFQSKPSLMWPYTLDYRSTQDCVVGPCPTKAYKGFWQFPILAFTDRLGHVHATPGACDVQNQEQAFQLLNDKFQEHYHSNRAPYLLPLETTWLKSDFKLKGTLQFLDGLKAMKDVYLVSAWQALEWIRTPTVLSKLSKFNPWKCDCPPPEVCGVTKALTCGFDKNRKYVKPGMPGIVRSMRTCVKSCPPCYPWVNDPYGTKC